MQNQETNSELNWKREEGQKRRQEVWGLWGREQGNRSPRTDKVEMEGGLHLKGSIPQCSRYGFLSYHQCGGANRNITPANKLWRESQPKGGGLMNSEGENGRVRFNVSYQGFVFIFYRCCCGGCCCCMCALAGRKKKHTYQGDVGWGSEREGDRKRGRQRGLKNGRRGEREKENSTQMKKLS